MGQRSVAIDILCEALDHLLGYVLDLVWEFLLNMFWHNVEHVLILCWVLFGHLETNLESRLGNCVYCVWNKRLNLI